MKKLLYCLLLATGILSVSCENNDVDDSVHFDSTVVRSADDFTDPRDNNTYHCVQIGNQIWMAENLRYQVAGNTFSGCFTWGETLAKSENIPIDNDLFKKIASDVAYDPQYGDWEDYALRLPSGLVLMGGSDYIMMVVESIDHGTAQAGILGQLNLGFPMYYAVFKEAIENYKLDPTVNIQYGLDHFKVAEKDNGGYVSKYGFLYSYDAALAAVPDGWRLPTDEDWMKLETTLGMSGEEVLKQEAWRGNGMATLLNEGGESHFNAQKAGGSIYAQDNAPLYTNKDDSWYYWSSSKYQVNDSTAVALVRMSAVYTDKVWRGTSRITNGYRDMLYSVRCMKDAN